MKYHCWLIFPVALLLGGDVPARLDGALQEKAKIAAGAGRPVLEKKGYLVPVRTVVVTPEVTGRIVMLHCEEGTDVKEGELLAQIDTTVYALGYRRAQALVERARARQGLNEGKAELAMAEADRDKARYLLEHTKVYAPFEGTILARKAEEGGIIDRLHFNGYYSVCEMADLTKLEVDVPVEERDIHLIFVGQKCTIQTEAFPEIVYQGAVARLAPIADRAKSAIPVRVRVNLSKRDGNLRPEMGAVVRFLAKE